MSSEKIYLSADKLLNDAFVLGKQVLNSGFLPDILIALWRGGTPVAIAIQELLTYVDHQHQHFAIKTSHYAGIEERSNDIVIEAMEPVYAALKNGMRILLVDDVFDTGLSVDQVMNRLKQRGMTLDIRVAVPYFKPVNNRTARTPEYFLYTTNQWIVFPHELVGLNKTEILRGKASLESLKEVLD